MTAVQHAGDLAHARTDSYRRRRDQALELIGRHCGVRRMVCGTSWGKDSVALLSLVAEAAPRTPVVHYRWPLIERPTGLDDVRDTLIARYGLCPRVPSWEDPGIAKVIGLTDRRTHSAEPGPEARPSRQNHQVQPPSTPYVEVPLEGQTSAWSHTGRPSLTPQTDEEREAWRGVMARNHDRFAAALHELDAEGSLIGIRREESRGRRVHLARTRGEWVSPEWGLVTVAPLAGWTGRDVWARHAEAGLPHAPHYDLHPEGRDRCRSEITFAAAARSWSHGMASSWAAADPALWRRLTAAWPEVTEW